MPRPVVMESVPPIRDWIVSTRPRLMVQLVKRLALLVAAVTWPLSPKTRLSPLPATIVSLPWPPMIRSSALPVVMMSLPPSFGSVEKMRSMSVASMSSPDSVARSAVPGAA